MIINTKLGGNTMQIKNETTGYPSIDKPWLKYFSKEAITQDFIECNGCHHDEDDDM